MIFIAVAAFYTPFCLQVLTPSWRLPALVLVWAAASMGCVLKQFTRDAPPWLAALPYVLTGWLALVILPGLLPNISLGVLAALIAAGGVFTTGALVFATGRPSPFPAHFGHHEVFHALVAAGCCILYIIVAVDVLPRA